MSKRVHGLDWADQTPLLMIELAMVRKGGRASAGQGEGMFHHARAALDLMWPGDDHHRWSDQILHSFCENEITILCGPADSAKTYSAAKWILLDYWASPNNTLWLVSSTELIGAELRIWGKIKDLFNRAKQLHPYLPGNVLEAKHTITTEQISDGSTARSLLRGIIFIACRQGGRWVGMGNHVGIKPTKEGRFRHCGDECSFMTRSFLDAYANWYGKPNFQGILNGNPIELDDPLCTAAEPLDGWANWRDTGKTQEWTSKWYGAHVLALDGRDSPNFEFPELPFARYPYLIGKKKIDAVQKFEGDSDLFYNQCIGKPRPGAERKKVITRVLCEQGKAFEKVVWAGSETTHIVANDAAYSGVGGDRCVLIHCEFGRDVENKNIFCVHQPVVVPVHTGLRELPEDQIAKFARRYCEGLGVPPENFFFDARATLAVAYARLWSPNVNAVDFGGAPTDRPVSQDEYVWEGDMSTRRLKKCSEHYSKFVTELWYSVRYAILGQQVRELPVDVAEELWKREYDFTKGNRIEVESKVLMKKRTKFSPDLADSLVTALEGARRKGFLLQNMKMNQPPTAASDDWLAAEVRKHKEWLKSNQLSYE